MLLIRSVVAIVCPVVCTLENADSMIEVSSTSADDTPAPDAAADTAVSELGLPDDDVVLFGSPTNKLIDSKCGVAEAGEVITNSSCCVVCLRV